MSFAMVGHQKIKFVVSMLVLVLTAQARTTSHETAASRSKSLSSGAIDSSLAEILLLLRSKGETDFVYFPSLVLSQDSIRLTEAEKLELLSALNGLLRLKLGAVQEETEEGPALDSLVTALKKGTLSKDKDRIITDVPGLSRALDKLSQSGKPNTKEDASAIRRLLRIPKGSSLKADKTGTPAPKKSPLSNDQLAANNLTPALYAALVVAMPEAPKEEPPTEMDMRRERINNIRRELEIQIRAHILHVGILKSDSNDPYFLREQAIWLEALANTKSDDLNYRFKYANFVLELYRFRRTPDFMKNPISVMDMMHRLNNTDVSGLITGELNLAKLFRGVVGNEAGPLRLAAINELGIRILSDMNKTGMAEEFEMDGKGTIKKMFDSWGDGELQGRIKRNILELLREKNGAAVIGAYYQQILGVPFKESIETALGKNPHLGDSVSTRVTEGVVIKLLEQLSDVIAALEKGKPNATQIRVIETLEKAPLRPPELVVHDLLREQLNNSKYGTQAEKDLRQEIRDADEKVSNIFKTHEKEERERNGKLRSAKQKKTSEKESSEREKQKKSALENYTKALWDQHQQIHLRRSATEAAAGLRVASETARFFFPERKDIQASAAIAQAAAEIIERYQDLNFSSHPVASTAAIYGVVFNLARQLYGIKIETRSQLDDIRDQLNRLEDSVRSLDSKVTSGFRDAEGKLERIHRAIQDEFKSLRVYLGEEFAAQKSRERAMQSDLATSAYLKAVSDSENQQFHKGESDTKFSEIYNRLKLAHSSGTDVDAKKKLEDTLSSQTFSGLMSDLFTRTYFDPSSPQFVSRPPENATLDDLTNLIGTYSLARTSADYQSLSLARMHSLGIVVPRFQLDGESAPLPPEGLLLRRQKKYLETYKKFLAPEYQTYSQRQDPNGTQLAAAIDHSASIVRIFDELASTDDKNRLYAKNIVPLAHDLWEKSDAAISKLDGKLLELLGKDSPHLRGYDLKRPLDDQSLSGSEVTAKEIAPKGVIVPCDQYVLTTSGNRRMNLPELPITAELLETILSERVKQSDGNKDVSIAKYLKNARALLGGTIQLCYDNVDPVAFSHEIVREKKEAKQELTLLNATTSWLFPFSSRKTDQEIGGITDEYYATLGIRLKAKLIFPNSAEHPIFERQLTLPGRFLWSRNNLQPTFVDKDAAKEKPIVELDTANFSPQAKEKLEQANEYNRKQGEFLGYKYTGHTSEGSDQRDQILAEKWGNVADTSSLFVEGKDVLSQTDKHLVETSVRLAVQQELSRRIDKVLNDLLEEIQDGAAKNSLGKMREAFVMVRGSRLGLLDAISMMMGDSLGNDPKLIKKLAAIPDEDLLAIRFRQIALKLSQKERVNIEEATEDVRNEVRTAISDLLEELLNPDKTHVSPMHLQLNLQLRDMRNMLMERKSKERSLSLPNSISLEETDKANALPVRQADSKRINDFAYWLSFDPQGPKYPVERLKKAILDYERKYPNTGTAGEEEIAYQQSIANEWLKEKKEKDAKAIAQQQLKDRRTAVYSQLEPKVEKLTERYNSSYFTNQEKRAADWVGQMAAFKIREREAEYNLVEADARKFESQLRERVAEMKKHRQSLKTSLENLRLSETSNRVDLYQTEVEDLQGDLEADHDEIETLIGYLENKKTEAAGIKQSWHAAQPKPEDFRPSKGSGRY